MATLTEAEALALGARALAGAGVAPHDARAVAAHLVDAMLCGYASAGLIRVPAIAAMPEMAAPKRAIAIRSETATTAIVDGGGNLGYLAVPWAAEVAMAKARAHGMAAVGIVDCWLSGRNAYYVEAIARAGFVAIHTVSSAGMVAPPGAAKPALGTNPISASFPLDPDPLVIDMATAAATWADVHARAASGEPFPEPVGVDADGNPTADAAAIARGGLLPFGGHKGFGLSLMVQSLSLMAGASLGRGRLLDFCPVLLVLDPDAMIGRDRFKRELREMLDGLKSLPRRAGAGALRLPSERAFAERARRRRDGIEVDDALIAKLRAMGGAA